MNPEERIVLLYQVIDEILTVVQQAIQSGEEIPDELQALLAKELSETADYIEQLRQQGGIGQGIETREPLTKVPQLDQGPFESSNVNSFKYNPDNGQLFVKFHGKDSADSGPIYQYSNIPKYIYDVFARGGVGPKTSGQNQYHRWIKGVTPSLGASLNALIKQGGFSYNRLT